MDVMATACHSKCACLQCRCCRVLKPLHWVLQALAPGPCIYGHGTRLAWNHVHLNSGSDTSAMLQEATPLSGSNKRNAAEWGSALLRTSLDSGHSLAQMADRAVRERALPAVTGSAAVVGQAVMGGSREAAAVSRNVLQRAGRDMAGVISQTQQAASQARNWMGASTAQVRGKPGLAILHAQTLDRLPAEQLKALAP